MANKLVVNYKELYECVAAQIRMEAEFAHDAMMKSVLEVRENDKLPKKERERKKAELDIKAARDQGIYVGYELVVKYILDHYEKDFGLSK